ALGLCPDKGIGYISFSVDSKNKGFVPVGSMFMCRFNLVARLSEDLLCLMVACADHRFTTDQDGLAILCHSQYGKRSPDGMPAQHRRFHNNTGMVSIFGGQRHQCLSPEEYIINRVDPAISDP